MVKEEWSPGSAVVHAGTERVLGAPVAPPLVPTSTYVSWGEPDPPRGYARNGNATWESLEQGLGALEQAHCLVFASGQAAAMAVMLALCAGGRRLVLADDGYYNTRTLAERLRPGGLAPIVVDLLDLDAVARALAAGPAVLWAETPTNPLLRVADLVRLGGLAAQAGAPVVADNTVATAVLQRPLDLGATVTVTALTKSASGHSDLILGATATRDEALLGEIRLWRTVGGAIAGPFEAWLALRGLKTLRLRIREQSANALAIARHLAAHPRVRAVHYPGLGQEAPWFRQQMPDGGGPLLSFELAGGAAEADAVVAASRLIVPATSFGGVESTWERRARWPAEEAPAALIRLSAGIEPIGDLLADLDHSLSARA